MNHLADRVAMMAIEHEATCHIFAGSYDPAKCVCGASEHNATLATLVKEVQALEDAAARCTCR